MKNKTLNRIYVAVSIVFFITLWTLKILEDTHIIGFHTLPVRILVPGFVGVTMLFNLLARGFERTWFITVALLFAMLAETINALNMSFGLLFFAVTHACLLIFHWKKTARLENAARDAEQQQMPPQPHLPYARYRKL